MAISFNHSDDLDSLLNGPKAESVKPANGYESPRHLEACRKCGGSGYFRSYSGRVVGPCFACKGKAVKAFKTAPEVRGANRVSAAARKVRTEAENAESFAANFADIWQWIESAPGFQFAQAMRDAVRKYGYLTDGQTEACRKCMTARDNARKASEQRRANAPQVEIGQVAAALEKAKANGLKHPRLLLDSFAFSLAPATGQNAGAIYVKEASGEYLGKIVGGKFLAVRACGAERESRIVAVASKPLESAIAYGKLTGRCACCARELTNPESVARGIGPICASKYF